VAPVTTEYFPAKASESRRVRGSRFEDKRSGELTKEEGEKVAGENTFDSGRWVGGWVMRKKKKYEVKIETLQGKKDMRKRCVGKTKDAERPHPQSMRHIETQVPAIQAEQAEDDVDPVTAEYVPAKASHDEYAYVDSNTNV
jgi:hypothetical protein